MGCRANRAKDVERHHIEVCPERDIEGVPQTTLFMRMLEQFERCEVPRYEQGVRCWVGWLRCTEGGAKEGDRGECRWSRLARIVVCALLSSRQQQRVTEWLIERGFSGSAGSEEEQ